MFIENKVAIVTGGASGIGLYCALELLKNNVKGVTLADVDPTKGQEAVDQITKEFGVDKVIFVKTDVASQKQMEDAFKKTVEKFGNIDIVVNNAGIMTDKIWEQEIAVNMKGTIYGCLLAMEEYIPKYKSSDAGVIVNISSTVGVMALPGLPIYGATKHAIIGLSRSLGTPDQYETTKVKVVTICPGATNTALVTKLDERALNDRYLGIIRKLLPKDLPTQSPSVVSRCLIKAVEEGANGSIWIAEANEIYEIEIPERQAMRKK